MNRLALPLLVLLSMSVPAVLSAAEPAARPTIPKRVWTSEDVEALRAKGLISLIGPETPAATPTGGPEVAEPSVAGVPHPVRAQDPDWYTEQLTAFRATIETSDAEIRLVHREVRNARHWEAGINLVKENTGITPESGLEILNGRSREALGKIDALGEQARRNVIPPGALR
jgi:hypothetical protein